MMTRTCLLALALLLATLPLHAQNVEPEQSVVTPEKSQRIERLLEVTGALNIAKMMSEAVTRQMTNAISQARPDIPAEAMNIVAEETNAVISEAMVAKGGFIDLIIPVYAKHFSTDELDALIAFYESPVGSKTVRVMPQITREAMQIGQAWGQSLGPTIVERVKVRFEEKGYQL
ncbi:MAG: DUF2059 domain-containing protein [Betaproteobacteria bacterium]|nr:MAG: DUF2059 domain-containing protein [Betaproteobacteria bacterium]